MVIKVSREPAENTRTLPLGLALAEAEGVELDDAELELEEELLQPARARPIHPTASRGTNSALFLVIGAIRAI